MNDYLAREVTLISTVAAGPGATRIQYRPILDSLYYCPGAKIKASAERLKVTLVRRGLKERCAVDARSVNAGDGSMTLEIPGAADRIDLVFRDREVALSPLPR